MRNDDSETTVPGDPIPESPGGEAEGPDAETTGELPSEACAAADARPAVRVLVIDDEAPVANFLADALRAQGIEPVIAVDGLAGLQAFREEVPDLIFCDLLIPKRNGFQLLEDFRRDAPAVPVVAMSGIYRREKYPEELAHARLFLTKPLDLVQVQEAIQLLRERPETETGERERAASPAPARPRSREPWLPTSVLPLPRLLHLLWKDRRTGIVTLRSGERQFVLMIQEGRLHFVRSNDPELRLDRILLQLGRVTPAKLQEAQAELQTRNVPTRLGEVLVEQETLTSAELDRALQVQLRRIVAAAFSVTDGETLFSGESLPPGEDVVIDADLRSIVLTGCLAVRDTGERLLGHLPDGACMVRVPEGGVDEEHRMPVTVRRLLEAAEEPTRLSDLIAMADLLGLRGRWLAFGLLCSEALVIGASEPTWKASASRSERARTIDGVPLQALLALESEGATGILRASWGDVTGWMALQDGCLVQAGCSDARTRIGGLLKGAGLVSPDQLHAALQEQSARPGRPLGHVLVEMGLVSPRALKTALPAQVACVAREMAARASWDRASFTPNEAPEREPLEAPTPLSDVVLGAVREMDDRTLTQVVRALAPGRAELDLDALRDGRLTLTEGEEAVADALSPDTTQLRIALASEEAMDAEVLRVIALTLLVTEPEIVAA